MGCDLSVGAWASPSPSLAVWLLLATTRGGPRRRRRPLPRPAPLRIDFISVGQGDAALVTSPTGKTVLIDGGPREAGTALTAPLRARRATAIDLVLLTHRHEDHLGGLIAVVRAFRCPAVHGRAVPHTRARSTRSCSRRCRIATSWCSTRAQPHDRPRRRRDAHPAVAAGSADHALALGRQREQRRRAARLPEVGILFAADAEPQTERWLLASDARLPAQVLKVAHHGGRYSSTARFLRAVAPQAAVISVGEVNGYGHPTPEALARLERAHARVYRTDQDGTVTVETDGARIEVTTASGKREILRGSR